MLSFFWYSPPSHPVCLFYFVVAILIAVDRSEIKTLNLINLTSVVHNKHTHTHHNTHHFTALRTSDSTVEGVVREGWGVPSCCSNFLPRAAGKDKYFHNTMSYRYRYSYRYADTKLETNDRALAHPHILAAPAAPPLQHAADATVNCQKCWLCAACCIRFGLGFSGTQLGRAA